MTSTRPAIHAPETAGTQLHDGDVAVLRTGHTDALDDAELVAQLVAGSSHAAAELWDRYAELVRRVVRRTLGDRAEVEDLVQDTFIGVLNGVHRLREPSALRGYVLRVASNRLRSELRRRKRRREVVGAVPETAVAAHQEVHHAMRRLYAVLDTLSAELRLVFVLRHIEQLELTEVADAMGMSLATVKRRLRKADALVHRRARRDPVLRDWMPREEGPS